MYIKRIYLKNANFFMKRPDNAVDRNTLGFVLKILFYAYMKAHKICHKIVQNLIFL